jgi:outer membrane protein assembly factor BamB
MRTRSTLLILGLILASWTLAHAQSDWPQFRGAGGTGIARADRALPDRLDPEQNLIWKCEIPYGHSSPCIWSDRIFLTGITGTELETICIDRGTGEILWRASAWYEFIERVHRTNSPATPTPTTDGKHVFVYFGSSGLLCYDLKGHEVWRRIIRIPPNLYGTASSVILAGGFLIFLNDNKRQSSLEALDPTTGKTVWRTERKGLRYNWSTPMCWSHDGVDELVINGQGAMLGYRLKDGVQRWSLPGLTPEPCVTPVPGDGLIFVTSYNMKTNAEVIGLPAWSDLVKEMDTDGDGELTLEETRPNRSILSRADADGEGDHPLWGFHRFLDQDRNGKITGTEWGKIVRWVDSFPQMNALVAVKPPVEPGDPPEIVWKHEKGVPEVPSPLFFDHRVYLVKNGGLVTCLESKTGKLLYRGRLGAGGPYYASPVAGDGKVYAASRRGIVTVFKAGDALQVLSRNDLGERIWATPALVDGKVYVRTGKHLHAFGR